jgi:hypothetical protein
MLEWSIAPGIGDFEFLDRGRTASPQTVATIDRRSETGRRCGRINVGQYRIVHASNDADVLVTAGAGTGKTETMAERLVFLLATSDTKATAANDRQPFDLRLDDVALVTFTRESAREMPRTNRHERCSCDNG